MCLKHTCSWCTEMAARAGLLPLCLRTALTASMEAPPSTRTCSSRRITKSVTCWICCGEMGMGCKGAACSNAEGRSKGTLLPISTCSNRQPVGWRQDTRDSPCYEIVRSCRIWACMRSVEALGQCTSIAPAFPSMVGCNLKSIGKQRLALLRSDQGTPDRS